MLYEEVSISTKNDSIITSIISNVIYICYYSITTIGATLFTISMLISYIYTIYGYYTSHYTIAVSHKVKMPTPYLSTSLPECLTCIPSPLVQCQPVGSSDKII